MSDKPDKAAAGVSVSKHWWGRETKTNIMVRWRDSKITD